MRLNAVEPLLVKNPIRDVFLRNTLGWLYDAACAPVLDRVLEIGCGQDIAPGEIAAPFHPRAIDAFDLDDAQVARAREDVGLRVEHLRSGFLPGWHQGVAVRA